MKHSTNSSSKRTFNLPPQIGGALAICCLIALASCAIQRPQDIAPTLNEPASASTGAANLILAQNLEYAPDLDDFDVETFLGAKQSGLKEFSITIDATPTPVASIIQAAARKHSINPRVLLVLLELKSGLVSAPSPSKLSTAAGYPLEKAADFSSQVDLLAGDLAEAYRAASMGDLSPTVTFSDKVAHSLPETLNTASAAIWETLAQNSTRPKLEKSLSDPVTGFAAVYSAWFGDPFAAPAFIQTISLPPAARLPFAGTKYYTSGPHTGGFCTQQDIASASGIDFARSGQAFEVLSIAEGQYLGKGEKTGSGLQAGKYVLLQHPGGAQTMYWHLSDFSPEIEAMEPGQSIPRGFPIGWAGDSGNQSAVHLHLELRTGANPTSPYSGVRLSWDSQALDGWTIWMFRWPGAAGKGISYRGTATQGITRTQTINNVSCDQAIADAHVGSGYPASTQAKNQLDPNTVFANYPDVVLLSSNNIRNPWPPEYVTLRVSTPFSSTQAEGVSAYPAISADGRYVAFESIASTLTPSDTNDASDIFVRDVSAGQTARVSVAPDGTQADADSYRPALSADGRYVAFHSLSSNLVLSDTNDARDIFVHERQSGQTTRVSVASNGAEGNGDAWEPSISADGRYVAFYSSASNLVVSDTNGVEDIFVHDRLTGQTGRVSISSGGAEGDGKSSNPVISADGRYVAFDSLASNLVVSDTNGAADVFVHDRDTGQTTRISVDSGGAQGNARSSNPALSANGRYVAFESLANNLMMSDTNGYQDVFIHDRQTGLITMVSMAPGDLPTNGSSGLPSLSADGRYVLYTSFANNLTPDDTNTWRDIFVCDWQARQTRRASVATDGAQADGESVWSAVSADGHYATFASKAANLVPDDANDAQDIFVRGPFYFISGRALDADGQALPSLSIVAEQVSAVTDANGYYTFTHLISGAYTLVPGGNGALFRPATRAVSVPPNATGQDFTAIGVAAHRVYLPLVLRETSPANPDGYR